MKKKFIKCPKREQKLSKQRPFSKKTKTNSMLDPNMFPSIKGQTDQVQVASIAFQLSKEIVIYYVLTSQDKQVLYVIIHIICHLKWDCAGKEGDRLTADKIGQDSSRMLKDKLEADNIGQSEERLVDRILQQEGGGRIGQDKI